jgi:hypothetical protein
METFARIFETLLGQVLVTKEYDDKTKKDALAIRWEPLGGAAATTKFSYTSKDARDSVFDSLTTETIARITADGEIDDILARLGNRFGTLQAADTPSNRDLIRRVFLANGFTVKEGQDDLKPYVYAAGIMLIACVMEANP